MFGKDIKKFEEIKNQACFPSSEYYDGAFMDEIYHKIIFSLGINELENIVRIPKNIPKGKLKRFIEDREENFKELYDIQYKIEGNFGTTLEIIKILKGLKVNEIYGNSEQKNNIELCILKMINMLLEEGNVTSISSLIMQAIEKAGYSAEGIKDRLKEEEGKLNNQQFKTNIEKSREKIIEVLKIEDDDGPLIEEAQINPIEKMIEEVLEKIYKENGKIDVENLRSQLIEALTSPDIAIHIRQRAERIADRIIKLQENDKEFYKAINYSIVDAIKEIKKEIGKGWIRKISEVISLESIPEYYTEEAIKKISEQLGIKIETTEEVILKSKEDREKAYKILEKKQEGMPEEERIIITYKQLHDMFGEVHEPYSEEFKKYFKKHREEFLRNPRYIYEFANICNNFERIINSSLLFNKYKRGKLKLENIIGFLESLRNEENEQELYINTYYPSASDEEKEAIRRVINKVEKKERTSVPPVFVKGKKYRGRMLSPNDMVALLVGNIIQCCQQFKDVGMGSMLLDLEENCGIFVIEVYDQNGNSKIIGQSLVIRQIGENGNNDRLTFDNIEIARNVRDNLTDEEQEEILRIYQEAGKQAIELDKKFLERQLKEGLITQEMYDNLVIKEVIAGRGYNSLKPLDNLPRAKTVVPKEAFYRYHLEPFGRNIRPWIDSTEDGVPHGSKGFYPVILSKMGEEEKRKLEERNSKGYRKTEFSEVPLWYGYVNKVQNYSETTITEDQIEKIKKIERKVYRKAQQIMNENDVKTIADIKYYYELDCYTRVAIGSRDNWYMIYGEGEKELIISDIALEGGMNSNKRRK